MELTDAQFGKISDLVRNMCGINLHDGKKELVKARLNKRLRKLGISSFDQYLEYISRDGDNGELTAMLDALSTNLTSFFREVEHFEYFSQKALAKVKQAAGNSGGRLRIWSAGCSSGEEPYSIAISVCDAIPNLTRWDARILATDISTRVLDHARGGSYDAEKVKTVPQQARTKYFQRIGVGRGRPYRVSEQLRKLVHFSRVNLMDPWPMQGPFDVIFCRNVMIYFDKPTQGGLVNRFWDLLGPGGTLFIGHSESLTGIKHRFKYVQPTVYEKP